MTCAGHPSAVLRNETYDVNDCLHANFNASGQQQRSHRTPERIHQAQLLAQLLLLPVIHVSKQKLDGHGSRGLQSGICV